MYWPETPNDVISPRDTLTVSLSSSTPYAEYTVRNFLLKHVRVICVYHPYLVKEKMASV